MYSLVRPLLFRLDPERAHHLTLSLLRWAGRVPAASALLRALFEVRDARLEVEAFGLRFKNPVGLAAGYDKDGRAVRGLSCLGFGHLEVGTVTLRPQPGNPRPRVFRIPPAQAVINRMGFPNGGVDAFVRSAQAWRLASGTRIGINIGKGKDTPLERAAEDYCALLRRVQPLADYVAVNISSPNTLGLRQLQAGAAVEALLQALAAARAGLVPRVPLLVKIAPDLSEAEIADVLQAALSCGVDGVIAANTTIRRDGLPPGAAEQQGGLSGAPLRDRSTGVIRFIARETQGRLPIIGVGGIIRPADALEKLEAGAVLVQLYTGLIYAGPGLAAGINRALLAARG